MVKIQNIIVVIDSIWQHGDDVKLIYSKDIPCVHDFLSYDFIVFVSLNHVGFISRAVNKWIRWWQPCRNSFGRIGLVILK